VCSRARACGRTRKVLVVNSEDFLSNCHAKISSALRMRLQLLLILLTDALTHCAKVLSLFSSD